MENKVEVIATISGDLLFTFNGVSHKLGTVFMNDDGFYVWEPSKRNGYIPADILRAIADKLDEMNEDWNKELNDYFGGNINGSSV